MNPPNREKAIGWLVRNGVFTRAEEGEPAMEFYIRGLMQQGDYGICDVDRWAHLNTLFGYELNFVDAMKIDNWLWDPDKNGAGEYETMELTYRDLELLMRAGKELVIELDFSKFRKTDFDTYEYFEERRAE